MTDLSFVLLNMKQHINISQIKRRQDLPNNIHIFSIFFVIITLILIWAWIMNKPVKLSEIIDGMESQTDEARSYLNKGTGEIVCISDEELSDAEEKRPLESHPEWQRDLIHEATNILEDDEGRYIALPSRFDIDEYYMMEKFALSCDEKFSASLLAAIKGKGAFRRFKDTVVRLGIEEAWYKFRDKKYKELAIVWCEDNNIEYFDEL